MGGSPALFNATSPPGLSSECRLGQSAFQQVAESEDGDQGNRNGDRASAFVQEVEYQTHAMLPIEID